MMLTFLALLSTSQVSEVLLHFEQFMKSANTLSVSVSLHGSPNTPDGIGTYVLEKPMRQTYRMKFGDVDYTFTQTERAMLEIDRSIKTYREYLPADAYFIPDSTITSIPKFGFPIPFIFGNLGSLIPSNAKYELESGPDAEGASTLVSNFTTPRGPFEVRVKVAKDGKLVSTSTAPKGAVDALISLTFSNYAVNQTLAKDAFSLKVPLGFVPEILPVPDSPVNVEMEPPLEGLAPMGGGKAPLSAAIAKKPALIVLANPDCEPSQRFLAALPALSSKLKPLGAQVAIVWTVKRRAKNAPNGFPEFYDPKGNSLDRFHAYATPFFMAVNSAGKIVQIWVGYDPSVAAKYEKEIVDAISAPAKGPK